jgi:hypothetical protein
MRIGRKKESRTSVLLFLIANFCNIQSVPGCS